LSDFIFSLIGKKQKLPDKIINGSIKLKKAFLKGYFSGDGGVCLSISLESRRKKRLIFSSNIFISCKPLKIRKELAHLLTSIGYNPTIGSSSIIISRKDNLSKFYNEIKFINNSIITRNSRYWHGFEKNQLLNYIINNLRNDKKLKLMFYNNTKEEVIKYIHKRLEAIGPKRKVLPIYKINFKPKAPSNAQF
jgi:intein/homing endonuclease